MLPPAPICWQRARKVARCRLTGSSLRRAWNLSYFPRCPYFQQCADFNVPRHSSLSPMAMNNIVLAVRRH